MPLHGLEHALMLTDDLEATRAFYCDALGFEAGARPPLAFPGYWLYLDDVCPCTSRSRRRTRPMRPASGCAAATAPSITSPSRRKTMSRSSHGSTLQGVEAVSNDVPAAGIRQLFVEDPNGVRIELSTGA